MISGKRVYDLVYSSLRRIGVVSLGDSIAPDVSQDALLELNAIRAGYSLSTKNNELFDQTYTVDGNRQYITLGTDGVTPGDIAVRPAKITQVVVINALASNGGLNLPLQLRPYEAYRRLTLQQIFAIPTTAYIDTSYPYQKVWFYPGLTPGWSVRVQGWSYMREYEALDDMYSDPPEWFAVLDLDLSLRLAPKYGVDLPPAVYAQLKSCLAPLEANQFMARLGPAGNSMRNGGGSGINFLTGLPNA